MPYISHYLYYPYYPFFRVRGVSGSETGPGGPLPARKVILDPPYSFLRVIRVIGVISRPGLGLRLTLLKEEWVIWVIDKP